MANKELKFSVIICVYNAPHKYLSECLDSIIEQSYENIEIIIIDDGSNNPDTLSCLDKYAAEYSGEKTLIVKHQPNGGQGKARNTGMSIATGDYLLFLDNDDYYMSDIFFNDLSVLLNESNADLCVFEYKEFFSDSRRPKLAEGILPRDKIHGKSTNKALKALLSAPRQVFSAATHTKVIKAKMMREHGILAPEGLSNEDNYLTAKIICHAKTFDRYNKVVHAYRRSNISSLSSQHDNSYKIADDILTQFDMLLSDKDCGTNRNVLDFLASPFVYAMGKVVTAKINTPGSDINGLIAKLKKYSYITKFSSRPYIRVMGAVIKIFGIKLALNFLRIFLTLNRKHMLSVNRKVRST